MIGELALVFGLALTCEKPVYIHQAESWRMNDARRAVGILDDATPHISYTVTTDPSLAHVEVWWEDTNKYYPGSGAIAWKSGDRRSDAVIVHPDSKRGKRHLSTLLHEFGHIAGLKHNESMWSVMGRGFVPWNWYLPEDKEELAKATCY